MDRVNDVMFECIVEDGISIIMTLIGWDEHLKVGHNLIYGQLILYYLLLFIFLFKSFMSAFGFPQTLISMTKIAHFILNAAYGDFYRIGNITLMVHNYYEGV